MATQVGLLNQDGATGVHVLAFCRAYRTNLTIELGSTQDSLGRAEAGGKGDGT